MAFYFAYGTENPERVNAGAAAEEVTQPLTYTYIPPGHPSRQPQYGYQPVYYPQYYQYPQYYAAAQPQYQPYTHDPNAGAYYTYPTAQVAPPQPPQPMYQYPYAAAHATPAAQVPAGAVPAGTVPWKGTTALEQYNQNLAAAEAAGANKPRLMVPLDDNPSQRLWVREFDGSYTLRSLYDITENLKPGEGGEFRQGQTPDTWYFHCTR